MVRTDEAVDSKNQPEYLFSDSTDRQKRLSHHRVPSPAYVFAPSWILPSNTKLKAAQSLAFSTFAKEESTQRPTPHSSQRKDHPGWKDISNSINTVDPTSTSMPHSTPSSTSSSFSSHGQVTRQKNPTIHPPTEEFPTLVQSNPPTSSSSPIATATATAILSTATTTCSAWGKLHLSKHVLTPPTHTDTVETPPSPHDLEIERLKALVPKRRCSILSSKRHSTDTHPSPLQPTYRTKQTGQRPSPVQPPPYTTRPTSISSKKVDPRTPDKMFTRRMDRTSSTAKPHPSSSSISSSSSSSSSSFSSFSAAAAVSFDRRASCVCRPLHSLQEPPVKHKNTERLLNLVRIWTGGAVRWENNCGVLSRPSASLKGTSHLSVGSDRLLDHQRGPWLIRKEESMHRDGSADRRMETGMEAETDTVDDTDVDVDTDVDTDVDSGISLNLMPLNTFGFNRSSILFCL